MFVVELSEIFKEAIDNFPKEYQNRKIHDVSFDNTQVLFNLDSNGDTTIYYDRKDRTWYFIDEDFSETEIGFN